MKIIRPRLAALLLAATLMNGCAEHRAYVPDHEPVISNAADADEQDGHSPQIVAGNEAFRIFEPAEGSVVGKAITVKGQARVFEAAFSYSLEDGHNVLAEGHATADKGAPEWGDFEFTVTLTEAPTSTTGVLTIYDSGAKDGSPLHPLHLAYTFENGLVKLQ
ncbi:Gmad2 immunoglobulin-like domain-containing protein [Paenibacillus montanisoli]|uniref:Bacterial spore germination immunoglobulin-like domain-containing protein n=1 Tax=Paenibacillus montanisoli TaxID=2081970 RepID=A0A328TX30_9BACL|nr:Gmad2 immunoglobulin-like domain-containing protein [Paenibacillus montanisoli]RAP74123.1 hypothetical protein DL346_23930 [Paenibacillus montanisoli]